MKVTVNEVKSGTLGEFADEHGFELVVNERELPVGDPMRYYASFKGVNEQGDGVLIGTYGDGATPQEAIEEYTEKISMKTLVFRGNTKDEKRIRAWRFEQ